MAQVQEIKNRIIDQLLSINSKELLMALNKILEEKEENIISLTKEQKELLRMSDSDIENGNIVSQSEIDRLDSKWIN